MSSVEISASMITGKAANDDSRFVTNGDNHDHAGGDGAQITYTGLSNKPILAGLDSEKPTPTNSGRFYWATDTLKLYFDAPT